MNSIINIGKKKQLFWDSYLIDESLTTASFELMHPIEKEICFSFDHDWEYKFTTGYKNIVKTDDGYRLYYVVAVNEDPYYVRVAMIESKDGLTWTRPKLNIYDIEDYKDNNIVLQKLIDNAYVFFDNNPDCPPDEKYKAICSHPSVNKDTGYDSCLCCYTSSDGLHFKKSHIMTEIGTFDTQNTAIWKDGKYICYIRDFHGYEPGKRESTGIRDIRVMYSDDFRNWTVPKQIEYEDGEDIPMYTGCISVYNGAKDVLIGFPVIYTERKAWTQNNDQFASAAIKEEAMKIEAREGLAVTDALFMHSRDGKTWHRNMEAFLTPGYEGEHNWVYGDCQFVNGLIDPGKDNPYYYMYEKKNHKSINHPKALVRYEIRKDGFVCIKAGAKEETIITKPIVFAGKDLHLNFSSSGAGYIYIDVLNENGEKLSEGESFEIYGNSINRKIYFADGSDFSKFSGKEVRLRFRMKDARLYSIWFE